MIGSHIIPKFYLEQFATPSNRGKNKPGRVWVYQKGRDPQERATSVQGRENGYFGFVRPDGSIEESFESVLAGRENECNEVLACAKSDLFHWPPGSHKKLAFYAGLLHARASQRRDFSERNRAHVIDQLREAAKDESLLKEIADALGRHLGQPVSVSHIRKGIHVWSERAPSKAAARNSYLSDLLKFAAQIAELLLSKQPWVVLRPSEEAEIVTSDNPLVTFVPMANGKLLPGYGFNKKKAVAVFPLAPTACLLMGDAWHLARSRIDAATLWELNEAIVSICDRYVYSKTFCEETARRVEESAGTVRYGVNAFVGPGVTLPVARQFLRRHLGLSPQ
jgi:hypothetical protein